MPNHHAGRCSIGAVKLTAQPGVLGLAWQSRLPIRRHIYHVSRKDMVCGKFRLSTQVLSKPTVHYTNLRLLIIVATRHPSAEARGQAQRFMEVHLGVSQKLNRAPKAWLLLTPLANSLFNFLGV